MSPLALSLVCKIDKIIKPSIAVVVLQLAGSSAPDPLSKPVYPAVAVCVERCLLACLVVPRLARLNGHGLPRILVSAATAEKRGKCNKSTAHHESSDPTHLCQISKANSFDSHARNVA
jgi:hypothetical protein